MLCSCRMKAHTPKSLCLSGVTASLTISVGWLVSLGDHKRSFTTRETTGMSTWLSWSLAQLISCFFTKPLFCPLSQMEHALAWFPGWQKGHGGPCAWLYTYTLLTVGHPELGCVHSSMIGLLLHPSHPRSAKDSRLRSESEKPFQVTKD